LVVVEDFFATGLEGLEAGAFFTALALVFWVMVSELRRFSLCYTLTTSGSKSEAPPSSTSKMDESIAGVGI
jgi:hypothetical protein